MRGLIIKDFLYIKNASRSIIVMFIGCILLSIISDSYFYVMSLVPIMLISMGINVFQTDEYFNTEIYTITYPVSRSDIVKSRYMFTWLLFVISIILQIILYCIFSFNLEISSLFISVIFSIIMLLFDFIFYPIMYKYGCEKSSYIFVTIMLVFIIALYGIYRILSYFEIVIDFVSIFNFLLLYGVYILMALVIICFIISILLSIKIYKKLDF